MVINGVIGTSAYSPSMFITKFSSGIAGLVGFFFIFCQKMLMQCSAVWTKTYQCQCWREYYKNTIISCDALQAALRRCKPSSSRTKFKIRFRPFRIGLLRSGRSLEASEYVSRGSQQLHTALNRAATYAALIGFLTPFCCTFIEFASQKCSSCSFRNRCNFEMVSFGCLNATSRSWYDMGEC